MKSSAPIPDPREPGRLATTATAIMLTGVTATISQFDPALAAAWLTSTALMTWIRHK